MRIVDYIAVTLVTFIFLAVGVGVTGSGENIVVYQKPVVTITPNVKVDVNITAIHIPVEKFDTKLWSYKADCVFRGILGDCNPSRYITPDNEVVRYYASFLELRTDGKLYWMDDNPFGLSGIFGNMYQTDNELYNNPPMGDYWVNPDYYLTHGMTGDCEDVAFAVASILEAKGYKAKIVGGWLSYNGQRMRDWMVEFKLDSGEKYVYFGGAFNMGFKKYDSYIANKADWNIDFDAMIMFDKSTGYENYRMGW